jgi:YVTN family beta-propeller protein
VTPDGRSIYVSEVNPPSYSGAVAVIDTATQTIVNTINVGDLGVGQLQVTPDGSQLYLVVAGGVVVIDTAAKSVVNTIDIPSATGLAVTPDGNQVYVTSLDNDSVYVIDTSTRGIVKTIGVGPGPTSCAVTPDGLSVFVGTALEASRAAPICVGDRYDDAGRRPQH